MILGFKIYYLAIITDFLYLIFFIIGNNIEYYQTDRSAHFAYEIEILIVLIILQTIGGILLFLSWYNRFFIFESDGITVKWGVFLKHEKKYNLKSVDLVNTEKSFFGNILGYGNVIIEDSFINEPVKLTSLSEPENFAKIIENNYKKENDVTILRKENRKEH